MRTRFAGLLTAALIALAAAHYGGTPPADAGVCVDPTPGAGGALQVDGFGTAIHTYTQEGTICPGDSETWSFSSVEVAVDQFLGVKALVDQGSILLSAQRNAEAPVDLDPGEAFRGVEPSGQPAATYFITVTGSGEELASYRVEACRSIYSPCAFANSGDSTCNDAVDSLDALAVLQANLGLIVLICPHMADVDRSGVIDAVDALLLLQHEVGLIGELPAQL